MTDKCNCDNLIGVPKAHTVDVEACEHGTLTIRFEDENGKPIACAVLPLKLAIEFGYLVVQELDPFLGPERLPGESPLEPEETTERE